MALTPEQEAQLLAHLNNNSNPHITTSSQVGLQSTDDLPEGHINLYGDTPDNVKYSATDVSSAGWVVDEDDMSSDSNKKVPTQQSVKKYIEDTSMAQEDYITSIGRIMNPLLHLPLKNGFNMPHGKGSVTFTRASSATYIDRYGVVQKVGSDVPRFEKEGLLIEGRGTNLLTYSEDFDNSAWHKGYCSISTNATTAPDDTNTADGIITDTTDTVHAINQSVITSESTLSFSCFLKAGEKAWADLMVAFYNDSGTAVLYSHCYFDLFNGVIGSKTGTVQSSTIINLGNDWYWCYQTSKYAGSDTIGSCRSYIYPAEADGDTSFAGDGSTINTYIWGAQLEEFPHSTSYIPTTNASATRAADVCYISAAENLPKEKTGTTIIGDFKREYFSSDGYLLEYISYSILSICIKDTLASNLRSVMTGRSIYPSTSLVEGTTYRIGMVDDGSNFSLYLNGKKECVNTVGTASYDPAQPIYLGYHISTYTGYGHISNLRIYDVALTEEEMKIA